MSESSVILKTPIDWDAWSRQFKAEAVRRDILDLIEGTQAFRTAPKLPEPKDFQTHVQTRASSTSQTASATSQSASLEWVITFADLSEAGKANIQFAYTQFKVEKDLYTTERDLINQLQTWMTKTVAPSYVKTCFTYNKNVKEWYEAVKKQVGLNESTIKQEIRDMYKRAIKPLTKMLKDIEP